MPVVSKRNKDGEMVSVYDSMVGFASLTDLEHQILVELKKQTAQWIDELNRFKKECEAVKDFENARFFRQEIADQTKLFRAIKLMLGQYGKHKIKDCPDVQEKDWPIDLGAELDYVVGMVS